MINFLFNSKVNAFNYLFPLFLLTLLSNTSFAQSIKVSGIVMDAESSFPLPGVTILVLGTDNGTVSDFEGNYTINVRENQQLQFSYIGYKTQRITIGDNAVINIKLQAGVDVLDEVVVIGYGSISKQDLTGAVSSVKGTSVEKGSPISIQSALAGRAAGVQVRHNDNGPGSGISVTIRGGSTLTGGNQPLYVIDGFPILPDEDDTFFNPLADLNPSQIESMEVLKDASATAIYGARGANGVIIINTRSGIKGTSKIKVGISSGVSIVNTPPKVISPEDFPNFMINRQNLFNYRNLEGKSSSIGYWQDIIDSGVKGSNWFDKITRNAITKNMDLSYDGGYEGLRYSVSGNILDQEGVVIRSRFNTANLNLKVDQEFSKKIKIGTNLRVSTSKNEGLVNSYGINSIIKKALQSNPFISPDFDLADADIEEENYSFNNENILTFINETDNQYETQRFIGNMFFEYKLSEGLIFYTSYGMNKQIKNEHRFSSSRTRVGFSVGGIAEFRKRETESRIYQARLNLRKRIKKHNINATVVFESSEEKAVNFYSRVQGFGDDSRGVYDLSSGSTPLLPTNIYNDNFMNSYLGRLVYSFNDKYLFTTSFRADGSSRFGGNNKWGYFPSAALGWVAYKEKFVEKLNLFSFLKVRLSYGITGNNQIPDYSSLARLRTEGYIFDDDLYFGTVPHAIANPDLKWERTSQYNAGIDMGFYDNRISLSLEYYYKKTTDLLLDVQLPTTSGFSSAIKNIGAISNQGLEVTLNTINFATENFKWNTSITFSNNRSKVLDLGERDEMFFTSNISDKIENDIIVRVGDPIGMYYGYVEDQIYNSENEIANSPSMHVLESLVGGVKIHDVNGDGLITSADKVPIAKTAPDFIGGMNNEFTYKNFDLSFFLRWSYGNDVVNGNLTFFDRAGRGNWNTLESYSNHIYSPLNPNGTIHGNVPNTYTNLMRSSYVEDGSFLKCDYITLGYSLAESIVGIKKLKIYARVTNPFMITRYSWFDPESSTGSTTINKVGPGLDLGSYPRSTTFTFGFLATL